MKTALEVSPEKLRGGFYTPAALVGVCLDRVAELLPAGARDLRVLEPSAGDGAFLRGLAHSPLGRRVGEVRGIELNELEAEKARQALAAGGLPGTIHRGSAVAWAQDAGREWDVAVGNPPFVRFQFVSAADRTAATRLGERLGVSFRGVSNLWIPLLLGALDALRPGGAFAFVIPTECFTGISARVVRSWLVRYAERPHFDLFPPGSFPGVLQEVTVLSGIRGEAAAGTTREMTISEHGRDGGVRRWRHLVGTDETWTRYLLDPPHLDALVAARELPRVRPLGDLATFEVSIVTGANDFFSASSATVARHGLQPWARPLLPRIRHAPGLRYGAEDQARTDAAGAKGWLLDFGPERPDPERSPGAAAYLRTGEEARLPARYKCRIREPWYRVPGIRSGALMLSKRSHAFPRVVVNEAGALTTDTIYRGRLLAGARLSPEAVAAGFHNSLTLLTAELEGRSFGGGVLELVPSEVRRLSLPADDRLAEALPALDRTAREDAPEALIARTNDLLAAHHLVPADLLELLEEARRLLLARRFARTDWDPADAIADDESRAAA